ncbi:osmotically-inducible protein OsmY [Silvimonas terrae]|uniref:Osmotically-inducible protein OsmY n=1 Tax=Silvimonas terrae TaxID=300266 RepID=A0A840RH41_9NEIS|nr:BON domain-containing protein [Silvimonas terrae]MBB5191750.1 osmotically-inducible protein OsmY [Silvimonas terrae]
MNQHTDDPPPKPTFTGPLFTAQDVANAAQSHFTGLKRVVFHVMAETGVVTISGTVESWADHNLAGLIALQTPGVRQVINNLTVIYR